MTVTEQLGALGSWTLDLVAEVPDYVLASLGYYGHLAVVDGPVDVERTGDGLLTAARYVGVLRGHTLLAEGGHRLAGSGMVFWLGDEDDKGHVIEDAIDLTDATLTEAVGAILAVCPSVVAGTIHPAAGTYTGRHQFQSPREALSIICDAFGVEFRVNGDATVDVGTAAELYNTASPDTIIVRNGAGADLDLVALGGTYEVDGAVWDYSTRVLLLGQTIGTGDTPDQVFATGAADVDVVPYSDLLGNPVKFTRMISESGETQGSVQARAQLQVNRFGRTARAVKLTAEQYESRGNFAVGDSCYVYDPDTGILDAANEVTFRGQVWHPDVVRIAGITWPVAQGQTVAFRTTSGSWVDLTPYVIYETGGNDVTVGDLPATLNRPSDNPVRLRADAARGSGTKDAVAPSAPTGLALSTDATLSPLGETVSTITAVWTAPATNTDGSVASDLDYYLVEYRPSFRAPQWAGSRVTDTTTVDLPGLVPDLDYDVRVAAVDTSGNRGPWSAVETVHASPDDIAPPAPADPVVTSYLGQLRIEYLGTDNLGAPMPSDTNRIDVHVGPPGFAWDSSTRVASLNPFAKGVAYATAGYGIDQGVRLVAYDHTGNPSAASGEVVGHTVQVADGDIASLSVGKLTSGQVDADVVIGGRFTTASAGARVEVNSVGVQKFDASEVLLVNITGTDALLTGTYRSAASGRRIEMGAAGSLGELDLYAPDGTRCYVRAYTETTGLEAMQVGIPIAAATDPFWNKIHMNTDEWMQIRTTKVDVGFHSDGAFWVRQFPNKLGTGTVRTRLQITKDGLVYWDGNQTERLLIQGNAFTVWDNNGVARMDVSQAQVAVWDTGGKTRWILDNSSAETTIYTAQGAGMERVVFSHAASANESAKLKLATTDGYAATLKFYLDLNPASNPRVEVRDSTDAVFYPVYASAFTQNSDRSAKTAIADLPFSGLDAVRKLRPRAYSRPMPGDIPALQQIGFVTDEMPAELVVGDVASGRSGIDLMAVITALVAAVQDLDRRSPQAGPPAA